MSDAKNKAYQELLDKFITCILQNSLPQHLRSEGLEEMLRIVENIEHAGDAVRYAMGGLESSLSDDFQGRPIFFNDGKLTINGKEVEGYANISFDPSDFVAQDRNTPRVDLTIDGQTIAERMKMALDAEPTPCQHEMVEYKGLMERFRYCKKCDHKEQS